MHTLGGWIGYNRDDFDNWDIYEHLILQHNEVGAPSH